jgi:hypothetical protein
VQIAWRARWNGFWRWALTALWLAIVLFETFFLLYFNVYFTTIVASMILGAALLCVSTWFVDRAASLDGSG